MSGADIGDLAIRKGAVDAVRKYVETLGGSMAPELLRSADEAARRWPWRRATGCSARLR